MTGNLNSWFGVTADFSGVYPSGFHVTTYTFGPKITAPTPVIKPFVHALFGGAKFSAFGQSINGFNMAIGGGADVGQGPFAWRVAQFDWLTFRFQGQNSSKNIRVSTGIVFRF